MALRKDCPALSGLGRFPIDTQGVALGWLVSALRAWGPTLRTSNKVPIASGNDALCALKMAGVSVEEFTEAL